MSTRGRLRLAMLCGVTLCLLVVALAIDLFATGMGHVTGLASCVAIVGGSCGVLLLLSRPGERVAACGLCALIVALGVALPYWPRGDYKRFLRETDAIEPGVLRSDVRAIGERYLGPHPYTEVELGDDPSRWGLGSDYWVLLSPDGSHARVEVHFVADRASEIARIAD